MGGSRWTAWRRLGRRNNLTFSDFGVAWVGCEAAAATGPPLIESCERVDPKPIVFFIKIITCKRLVRQSSTKGTQKGKSSTGLTQSVNLKREMRERDVGNI